MPLPDRPSGLKPGGGGRQSKSRRTTCRQAKGRLGASVSELAGRQGVPLTGRPSGPTPGEAAGSQSPGGPRADKPRVGWVTGPLSGRASAPFGARGRRARGADFARGRGALVSAPQRPCQPWRPTPVASRQARSVPPGPATPGARRPAVGAREGPTSHGPAGGPGGLAPLEPACGRGAPHPDRSPGPKIRGGSRAQAVVGSHRVLTTGAVTGPPKLAIVQRAMAQGHRDQCASVFRAPGRGSGNSLRRPK